MDFFSDMMSMFGPKSQKDRAFEEILTVVDCDEESDDSPYASERIITSAWDHAARMAADPSGVARSLPWDALSPRPAPKESEGTVKDPIRLYLDHLLDDSGIVWDSDAGYLSNLTGKPEEESGASWNPNEKGQRLTGEQLYTDHYVDRYLPGVVQPHPEDNRPTNAVAWRGNIDGGWGDYGDYDRYKELARVHPDDDPKDHEKFSLENSSARFYSEKEFCPVVTKAGSRLWSISFVAPKSGRDDPCLDMKAVYPGQITIRYDIGRHLLIYDMFEFKPATVNEFVSMRANGENVCTEAELTQVERVLRGTKRKRSMMSQGFMSMAPPVSDRECLSAENTMQERIDAIGEEKCCHLLNYVRFKKSRLLRIRFPLHGLRGVRVLELDCKRPNKDLPPPKGMHPVSRLGNPGDEGEAEGHNTFELCDDKIELLGMIVLEFGDTCGNFLSSEAKGGVGDLSISNKHPFVSTVAWPPNWRDRKRLPVKCDWTENKAFSNSRRHYIVGDASEIMELANFLMNKSSRIANMLSLPTDDRHASARKLLNSLSGDISILGLDQTPSDLFSDSVQVEKTTSQPSVPTLEGICIDALIENSGLKVEQKKERQFKTADDVHAFLGRCGLEEPTGVNMCLKAGLLNGRVIVPPDLLHAEDASSWLSTPLLSEECGAPMCGGRRSCTISDVLYQDHIGSEEEEGRVAAKCGGMFCSGKFVAGLCEGLPRYERINHNHCIHCPDFGKCIGYYKNLHCRKCGYHYTHGEACTECIAKRMKDARGNEPEDKNRFILPLRSSWDGLMTGCLKYELVEGIEKKKAAKLLRERLLLIQSFGMCEETDGSLSNERLKSVLSGTDYYDEISRHGCHMNLDDKQLSELQFLIAKVNEAMGSDG